MAGRPTFENSKFYLWKVTMYDDNTKQIIENKYRGIPEINKELNLNLDYCRVRQLMTGYRVDKDMKRKENSFLARYGHIKLEKIKERIEPLPPKRPRGRPKKTD